MPRDTARRTRDYHRYGLLLGDWSSADVHVHPPHHGLSWTHSQPEPESRPRPVRGMKPVRESRRPRLRRTDSEIDKRFEQLKQQWAEETRGLASVIDRFMHPAYQQIIGLGTPVVTPMVLDLREGPEHWFWALNAIVGFDAAAGCQTVDEAASRWVDWAIDEGLID